MYGRRRSICRIFVGKSEDIDENIILKYISNMLGGRGLGLCVAGVEHWLIILNAVMNNHFLHNVRNFVNS
jgi:hypothetical protein